MGSGSYFGINQTPPSNDSRRRFGNQRSSEDRKAEREMEVLRCLLNGYYTIDGRILILLLYAWMAYLGLLNESFGLSH